MTFVRDIPIPECLMRPLVFGDIEQIEAIKKRRRQIEEAELRQKDIDEGKLKEYEITIYYKGSENITVWAENETMAREIAEEDYPDCDDMEIDSITVWGKR